MPFNGRVLNEGNLTSTVSENQAELSANVETQEGELTGTVVAESQLTASLENEVRTLNATLNSDSDMMNASLSIHYGADGRPGKDGFSPTISVYKEDKKTYILKITDVNGSYLTPNLQGQDGEGAEGKVDEDLAKYRLVNPVTLNASQRDNSFMYLRRDDLGEGNKVCLSTIALKEEVDAQIRQKLQTVENRDITQWSVGDYIFLEKRPGEDS